MRKVTKVWICGAVLLSILALGVSGAAGETAEPVIVPLGATKADGPGARLLLPYYLVEKANPQGASTLYAVRNESTASVAVTVSYFETDRPQTAQRTENFTLAAKATRTVQVRDVPDLLVDDDGFARGFAIIESTGGEGSLHGDYFQVTPGDAFATGNRLVNIDPGSFDNDLCQRVTTRYLNGGAFDSGTTLFIWFESPGPPQDDVPVFFYSVYEEGGGDPVLAGDVKSAEVAFVETAAELTTIGPIIGPSFGVLEIEFNQTVGYVTAVMSASGQFSVSVEAVCLDDTPF